MDNSNNCNKKVATPPPISTSTTFLHHFRVIPLSSKSFGTHQVTQFLEGTTSPDLIRGRGRVPNVNVQLQIFIPANVIVGKNWKPAKNNHICFMTVL